jgi:hypothetical protein
LLNQHGQVLTAGEVVLVAEATLAAAVSAALLAAALALRQPVSAAFGQRRLFGVHTLPAEVSADQVQRLDSIMAALECLL